ncbi:hypothetical protein [Brucella anthropi]
MSSDHLTLPKVDLFLIAISTTSTDEEKEQAIFDLLAGPLPPDVRLELHHILEEINPIAVIHDRRAA